MGRVPVMAVEVVDAGERAHPLKTIEVIQLVVRDSLREVVPHPVRSARDAAIDAGERHNLCGYDSADFACPSGPARTALAAQVDRCQHGGRILFVVLGGGIFFGRSLRLGAAGDAGSILLLGRFIFCFVRHVREGGGILPIGIEHHAGNAETGDAVDGHRVRGELAVGGMVSESTVFVLVLQVPVGDAAPDAHRNSHAGSGRSPQSQHGILRVARVSAVLRRAEVVPASAGPLMVDRKRGRQADLADVSAGADGLQEHHVAAGLVELMLGPFAVRDFIELLDEQTVLQGFDRRAVERLSAADHRVADDAALLNLDVVEMGPQIADAAFNGHPHFGTGRVQRRRGSSQTGHQRTGHQQPSCENQRTRAGQEARPVCGRFRKCSRTMTCGHSLIRRLIRRSIRRRGDAYDGRKVRR